MKHKTITLLVLLWLLSIAKSVPAQAIALTPNQPVAVQFNTPRLLERGTPLAVMQNVTAQAEFSLDTTGSLVTIKLQNTSTLASGATLYALDLGLPFSLINQTRMRAAFSEFPDGGAWLGPTDDIGPTAATGVIIFAARAAVLGRVEDLLPTATSLPRGFLQAGQRGVITLELFFPANAKVPALSIEPRFYFLAPDARTGSTKRVQLVVNGAARAN